MYVYCFLVSILTPFILSAHFLVGVGKQEITPPVGSPSGGYSIREKVGKMEGVHDPLFAIALFMETPEKRMVFCSVDHLGFTYEMVQEVVRRVEERGLKGIEIYVGSSHTHAGGGGFLNVPHLGRMIAGPYQKELEEFYVANTVEAIVSAERDKQSGSIGIGHGKVGGLSWYRGEVPNGIEPISEVTLIKVISQEGSPIAALVHYACHPTILGKENLEFSADFVGYLRKYLGQMVGGEVLYFNGAQGDIVPVLVNGERSFNGCDRFGKALADKAKEIWDTIEISEEVSIQSQKYTYSFKPELYPVSSYTSEINAIVFNEKESFITIPGELSVVYDHRFKNLGEALGISITVLGLVNDAHGYIISPISWQNKTFESQLSFGGENYGEFIYMKGQEILKLCQAKH